MCNTKVNLSFANAPKGCTRDKGHGCPSFFFSYLDALQTLATYILQTSSCTFVHQDFLLILLIHPRLELSQSSHYQFSQ